MAKMDLPPDFKFERVPKEAHARETSESSTGEEDENPDDAARGMDKSTLKRKHSKVVTFANEPDHGKDDEDDEEEEETEEQRYMRMRYKRSGSLPSIELNRELARKIRRMLKDEEKDEEEHLNRQLSDGLKLSSDVDKPVSELKFEYQFLHGQVLQVRQGDITEEYVDILVNTATSNLHHTGGIAGAISQKGGRDIQLESDRWVRKHGPVSPGQVAVTEAGQLPCKWIIHAVGPIWRGGNHREDSELWDSIWNSLVWASKLQARSIALPAIGAGFLGFQNERCAYLLVDCIAKFFAKHPHTKLSEVRVVNINEAVTEAVVFEMVGKFTSGCETSESERDGSIDEGPEEDDDLEEIEKDFDDVADENEEDGSGLGDEEETPATGNNAGFVPPHPYPHQVPPLMRVPSKTHIGPAYLTTWRRQSIA